MNLFSNDISGLEKDIKILKLMLKKTRNTKQIIEILNSLNSLIDLKENITKKESLNIYSDKIFLNKYYREHKKLENKNIHNFIVNKNFHNDIATETLLILEEKKSNFEVEEKNQRFFTREMYEIMIEFLYTINNHKLLNKMIQEKRIFKVDSIIDIVGCTIFNKMLKSPYFYISKEINDVTKMTTIIHELGHIADTNRNTDSIYLESNAMIYEKKFLEFLINKEISPVDTIALIDDYYNEAFDNLKNVLVLTELDDNLIKNNNYKKVNEDILLEQLNDKMSLGYVDLSDVRYINLNESLRYSYGKLIATYFTNLEKRDKQLYKYKYNNFLNSKKNQLKVKEFKKIISNPEMLFKSLEQEISKDTKIKKKIIEN